MRLNSYYSVEIRNNLIGIAFLSPHVSKKILIIITFFISSYITLCGTEAQYL